MRQEILDRNGEVLARNYRTYTLEVGWPSEAGASNEKTNQDSLRLRLSR